MEQLKAFVVKFIAFGILTFSIFGIFFHATIGRLLLMTLIVVGLTFIGDLFILPRINHAVAAVADFVALFLVYWVLGNLVVEDTVSLLLPAFAAAYFGVLVEAVYHMYVTDRIHEPHRGAAVSEGFQTEIAEESVVDAVVDKEADGTKEQE